MSWMALAQELDRFRWQQLRLRHGIAGSAMRGLREVLRDTWWGWRARRALSTPAPEPVTYLLLQAAPKVIPLKRKQALIAALGAELHEIALQPLDILVRERQFLAPPRVPLRYFAQAAHACWLVQRYQPRVLLNDRNGSLYSPFLRQALATVGGRLVHLAHAGTLERSSRLDMNDYDDYFLFGRSSLEALQQRPLRFGTSRVLLSGSHMIDERFALPESESATRTLLILGVGPDKEKEGVYQNLYQDLQNWVAGQSHYRVLFKCHPRSRSPSWQQLAVACPQLQVLPEACTLAEALGRSSVVLNLMSNAVIEAALAERPILFVHPKGETDIFQQARFLGKPVQISDLDARLQVLEADYPTARAQARAFAEFHLAHGVRGLTMSLACLRALARGEALPADVETQTLRGMGYA